MNYLKVINFYENASNDVKIKLGNKAFAYEGLNIKADYINVLTQLFKSGLERVNFADSIENLQEFQQKFGTKSSRLCLLTPLLPP